MAVQKLTDLAGYNVIDLDTGTILGTNLVLVAFPDDEELAEELTESDSAAIAYGTKEGTPLLADVSE